jgi:hypothetical protein
MRTLVLIILVLAGLAFVAPPLIAFLPALLVGVLLLASPLLLRGAARSGRDDGATRTGQRPNSARTTR